MTTLLAMISSGSIHPACDDFVRIACQRVANGARQRQDHVALAVMVVVIKAAGTPRGSTENQNDVTTPPQIQVAFLVGTTKPWTFPVQPAVKKKHQRNIGSTFLDQKRLPSAIAKSHQQNPYQLKLNTAAKRQLKLKNSS